MTRSRSPRSSRSRSKARSSARPWLGLLLKLSLVGLVVLAGFAVYLDAVVQEKFSGKRWTVPAKVYARPLELFVGQKLTREDFLAELAACDLVVEAIVERLDAKQALFAQLEAVVGPHAVLATNTSSLAVTAIGATLRRPERLAGFHFFNPVPLMKVVEVVAGLKTDPAVCADETSGNELFIRTVEYNEVILCSQTC